jgi:dolichol-phosphate mannosyltransferase
MRVLVITPTYNEAENVGRHISEVLNRVVKADVLIVDDSSPDGTATIAREMADRHPGRVELLERAGKQGLGSAYVAGFRWALEQYRWDVFVQMDVDGSHEPRLIDDVVAGTAEADLVIGSRYVAGGRIEDWPRRRRALSSFGNRYARTILGVQVRDLTGGFKAWRPDLLRKVDVETLSAEGYAFQIESTVKALRLGARVSEVPILFRDRQLGESKMSSAIAAEAMTAVWRIWRQGHSAGSRP